MPQLRFLVVGDSSGAQWCEQQLAIHQHDVIRVPGGLAALREARVYEGVLGGILCTTSLPDIRTDEFIAQVRLAQPSLYVMVLPAENAEAERSDLLHFHEAGASDCLWSLSWERLRARLELVISSATTSSSGRSNSSANARSLPPIYTPRGNASTTETSLGDESDTEGDAARVSITVNPPQGSDDDANSPTARSMPSATPPASSSAPNSPRSRRMRQRRSLSSRREGGPVLPIVNAPVSRAAVADEIRTIVRWFQASPQTRLGTDAMSTLRFEELAGLVDNLLPTSVAPVVLDSELDTQSSAWISSQFCREDDGTLAMPMTALSSSPLAKTMHTTSTVSLTESSSGGSSAGLSQSYGSLPSYAGGMAAGTGGDFLRANDTGDSPTARDTLDANDLTLDSISQVSGHQSFNSPRGQGSTTAYWDRDVADLRKAKAELLDISFNPFAYTETELIPLVLHMFQYWHLLERFNIPLAILENFVVTVKRHYPDNAFHNWYHAFDVTQTVFSIVSNRKMRSTHHNLTEQDRLVLLVSALCHDLQHPGHNNAFEIATGSERAFLYNDQAVLENHHAHTAFVILSNPATDILANFPKERRRVLRKSIIDCILATDMKIHFSIVNQFNDVKYAGKTPEERQQLMSLLVHAADISNVGKPLSLAKKWGAMVQSEFFSQGDKEKKLRLPVSPFMDRDNADTTTMTKNFIDLITMPTFMALTKILPACNLFVENMKLYRKRLNAAQESQDAATGTEKQPPPAQQQAPQQQHSGAQGTPGSSPTVLGLRRPDAVAVPARPLPAVRNDSPLSGFDSDGEGASRPKPPAGGSPVVSRAPRRKLSVISIGLDAAPEVSSPTFAPRNSPGTAGRELPPLQQGRARSNSITGGRAL